MSLKIIVSYASAGSGHRRAAQALYHCLKENYPELNTDLIDIIEYTNSLFGNLYSRGYSFLVTQLRFIWAVSFYLTSLKYICRFFNFICRLNCRRFIKLLGEIQPDIVLTTHFLPVEVVTYLKKKGSINSRLITVVTDFGLHPLWVSKGCDDYIVGSEFTRSSLVARGINQDKIKVVGIPIDSSFLIKHQRDRREGRLTALLVTGSFGFPLIEKAVDMLYSEIKLLVVCGNNQRLYNRLRRKRYTSVCLFGFSKDMQGLMSQVDVIITKAGGLTIAESMALELPLILIWNIPGQESENARILEEQGCAVRASNLKSLKDIIINLKTHPEKLDLMRNNIRKFKKPDAAEQICRFVKRSLDLWSDSEHKSIG